MSAPLGNFIQETEIHLGETQAGLAVCADGRILAYNERAVELLGYRPAIAIDTYWSILQKQSVGASKVFAHETPIARALLQGQETVEESVAIGRGDGSTFIGIVNTRPLRGSNGEITGAVTFIRLPGDPVGKEVIPSPDQELLPTLIGYVGADLRYRYVNAAYERWFGLSEREILGRKLDEVLGKTLISEIEPEMKRSLLSRTHEFERYVPNSRRGARILQVRYVPDTAPGGVVRGTAVIGTDISDSRRSQIAEISSKQMNSAKVEGAQVGTFSWTSKNPVLQWSARMREIHGVPPEEVLSDPAEVARRFVILEDQAKALAFADQAKAEGGKFYFTVRVKRPSGEIRSLEVRGFCSFENGSLSFLVGSALDVTKEAPCVPDLSLAPTTTSQQLVYTLESSGKPISFNQRWWEFTGLKSGEPVEFPSLLHPDDLENARRLWAERAPQGLSIECQARLRFRDGSYRLHRFQVVPVHLGDTRARMWYGTALDIEAQAEQRAKEKESATRLLFLSEACRIISESQNCTAGKSAVADLAVQSVGDGCVIDKLEECGNFQRVAARHKSSQTEASLKEQNTFCLLRDSLFERLKHGLAVETQQVDALVGTYAAAICPPGCTALTIAFLEEGEVRGMMSLLGPAGKSFSDDEKNLLRELSRRSGEIAAMKKRSPSR